VPLNHRNISLIQSTLNKNSHKTELMVVSKNRSFEDVRELLEMGYRLFGENRVQEAKTKFQNLISSFADLNLHLIGPLQSNKVRDALKIFHTIQSVDRKKIVKEIAKNIDKEELIITKNYFIQVNIGSEIQKSGISLEELDEFYEFCLNYKLPIKGLMCIPPVNKKPDHYFEKMVKARDAINSNLNLSMGMSSDYEIALKHQSDLIRIGSSFFQ
jgi:pyridoxal phosphate enzyme (YggS family)